LSIAILLPGRPSPASRLGTNQLCQIGFSVADDLGEIERALDSATRVPAGDRRAMLSTYDKRNNA
jgi:hypothetical protein